jgi:soluble lytic murein transglycosylase-like protein
MSLEKRLAGRRGLALLVSVSTVLAVATLAEAQIYTRKTSSGVVEATNVPDAADFRLTYPGKGTLIHSRYFRGTYRGEFDAEIVAAASLYGVSADLIKAVIAVESEFDQWAVSSKGAQGLMQLMPFTARRFGVVDSFDARQNIFGGVQFLRFLLDLFQGDVSLALAGYNAGENAVTRWKGIPPYRETQNYVRKIQGLLDGGLGTLRVASSSPAQRVALTPAPKLRAAVKVTPARPRIYYRWTDGQGLLHVAHTPPDEGVTYTMIRALD